MFGLGRSFFHLLLHIGYPSSRARKSRAFQQQMSISFPANRKPGSCQIIKIDAKPRCHLSNIAGGFLFKNYDIAYYNHSFQSSHLWAENIKASENQNFAFWVAENPPQRCTLIWDISLFRRLSWWYLSCTWNPYHTETKFFLKIRHVFNLSCIFRENGVKIPVQTQKDNTANPLNHKFNSHAEMGDKKFGKLSPVSA